MVLQDRLTCVNMALITISMHVDNRSFSADLVSRFYSGAGRQVELRLLPTLCQSFAKGLPRYARRQRGCRAVRSLG